MKNLKLLFTGLLIALTVVSCNFTEWDDIEMLSVSPSLFKKVPKLYPGGNVYCSQLDIAGLVQTTGRNDYASDGKFKYEWPSGLLVKVDDGKYVSFQIDGKIDLGDGKCYKVGAVIVKGSDASNVYNYVEGFGGVIMDRGLSAPLNSSGTPADLSNLTFCFVEVECDVDPVVIAIKSLYWNGTIVDGVFTNYHWAGSSGTYMFSSSWCLALGYNSFPEVSSFNLHKGFWEGTVGVVTVTENETSWTVKVDLNDGLTLDKTYYFVGKLSELKTTNLSLAGCPIYENWNIVENPNDNIQTFTILK